MDGAVSGGVGSPAKLQLLSVLSNAAKKKPARKPRTGETRCYAPSAFAKAVMNAGITTKVMITGMT